MEIWSATNIAALNSGGTFTATTVGGATNWNILGAVVLPGINARCDTAQLNSWTSAATTFSIATGTLATTNPEIVIGAANLNSTPASWSDSFTQIFNAPSQPSAAAGAFAYTTTFGSTAGSTWNPTFSSETNGVYTLGSFRQ